MPSPKTFGQLCMQAIFIARESAHRLNQKFLLSDGARIIDQLDEGRIPPQFVSTTKPESTLRPKSSNPSPFGDRRVIPPQPEWVTAYSASIGYPMDGEKWCDQYTVKGWMVGKTKMKDWQSGCRNWKNNGWGLGSIALNGARKDGKPTDYEKF